MLGRGRRSQGSPVRHRRVASEKWRKQDVKIPSIASADMDFNQLEAFLTAQTKKQGGITCEQAAVISRFWKSHKSRIRESLLNQSRWDNGLRGLSWRVDGKSQSRHSAQIHTPAAIIELEFGKSGQLVDNGTYFEKFVKLIHKQAWRRKTRKEFP
ncbi:hypothetical protein STEG23_012425 [Scotinomys teguina]